MTTVSKFFNDLSAELSTIYPKEEAASILRLVFEDRLGLTRVNMAMQPSHEIDPGAEKTILELVRRLKKGEPVQQVLGYAWFYGHKFYVNKEVLIPRPETEELVQWIISENHQSGLKVLDIGTGSGCIAISLAMGLVQPLVTGIDISPEALKTARVNAINNHIHVSWEETDILEKSQWNEQGQFDIIVSNPPYVLESEKAEMHINVLENEPHLALFVSNQNPLLFYHKISDFALTHLKPDGSLYFEINEKYGTEIKEMLLKKGFIKVEIRKDMNRKDRMIKAVRNDQ